MINISDLDAREFLQGLYEIDEVEKDAAKQIFREHRKQDKDLAEACLEHGVRQEAILYVVSRMRGLEMVQLDNLNIPQSLLDKVPGNVAHSYRIIPIRMEENDIVVATADPDNLAALDDLKFMLGVDQVRVCLTDDEAIDRSLDKYYQQADQDIEITQMLTVDEEDGADIDQAIAEMETFQLDDEDVNSDDFTAAVESAPVRKLLNLLLITAVKAQASDIHFEPFEEEFRVRNRIDGVLYNMLPVPKTLAPALIARIKVMSHLNISERRLPQDGKITVAVSGRNVDLRVSCLPTMFGESVVIRILDRSVVSLDLDKIGFEPQNLEYFRDVIQKPNGIIIVTGPTGSGKTTTLYAALNEVNDEGLKIITTEDPVEYEIDGLIQVQIDDEIDKTFSNCLRSILRQDPDKVLVGECRDLTTAQISIEASLTGHIVFTTLHTNDAPTAVTRLLDMGVEPFLLAATVECIVAQRLVRSICVNCKARYEPSQEELMLLDLTPEQVAGQHFYYGKGCSECKNTGYKGRTAIFEIMDIHDQIRDLILEKAAASRIRAASTRSGMTSLREAGIAKIFAGVTTIDEVVRETIAAED